MTYGISSIGTNDSSYYNPYMMSMMGGMGMMNGMNSISPYGGMGMMGMMGMMNPQYLEQMAEAQKKMLEIQHQAETLQAQHAIDSHKLLMQADVQNMSAHDRAFFQKTMVDGDINEGIKSLASVIRKGDSDAICEQYDKLKQNIYAKYGDEFIKNGIVGDERKVLAHIEYLYNQIITKQNGGEIADLKEDIKKYGETSFGHGFNKAFFGSKDYHGKYTEQVEDYIYNEGIDNEHGKNKMHKLGTGVGTASKFVALGVGGPLAGAAAGYGTAATVGGLLKLFGPEKLSNAIKLGKWGKVGATCGAIAGLIGGFVWQNT